MRFLPQELVDYYITFLSPPEKKGAPAQYHKDLHQIPWSEIPDESVTGLLTCGTPTEEEARELMRILKPGAHILLVAPEENPIGHLGVLALENEWFEVRDAVVVLEDIEDKYHYMPKVSRKERDAGCEHLPGKTAQESVGRDPSSAGARNLRAGAGRGAGSVIERCSQCGLHLGGGRYTSPCTETEDGSHTPEVIGHGRVVKNHHPTVKPWRLMQKLLADVPPGRVGDFFMGSGSTAIATLATGHDFVGGDQYQAYLDISDARVRYWKEHLSEGAGIVSDSEYAGDQELDSFEVLFVGEG